jgi:hypothetical protein
VGSSRHKRLTTRVYRRVAHRHEAHATLRVRFTHPVHSTLILAAYRHTSTRPVLSSKVTVGGSTRRHPAPALRHLRPGTWVVGYWTATSHATPRWRLPHALKRRASAHSRRRAVDSAVLADANASVAGAGTYRPGSARSSRRSTSAAQWSVALAPSLR